MPWKFSVALTWVTAINKEIPLMLCKLIVNHGSCSRMQPWRSQKKISRRAETYLEFISHFRWIQVCAISHELDDLLILNTATYPIIKRYAHSCSKVILSFYFSLFFLKCVTLVFCGIAWVIIFRLKVQKLICMKVWFIFVLFLYITKTAVLTGVWRLFTTGYKCCIIWPIYYIFLLLLTSTLLQILG